MHKGLIIVESPAKAKTIRQLLPEYETVATKGHLRDLPEKRLGLSVDKDGQYNGEWVYLNGQKATMQLIKEKAANHTHIFLAVDDDREGEAIAQQVADFALKGRMYRRIVFHEITKGAIEDAIANHARPIRSSTVTAQHIRRYADRLIGYPMSEIIKYDFKKQHIELTPKGIGRSISAALQILRDNHFRIENFTSTHYYQIALDYVVGGVPFRAMMKNRFEEQHKEIADEVMVEIRSNEHIVSKFRQKTKDVPPYPPLTTARMVRGAFYIFDFKPKQVMKLAQDLYEQGLITYMRTDSIHLSDEAVYEIIGLLRSAYSSEYYVDKKRNFKEDSKGKTQNAHEAIRPTCFEEWAHPVNIEHHCPELSKEHLDLYKFIFYRTVATQMSNATYDVSSVEIRIGDNISVNAEANHLEFAGWQVLNGAMLKESERNEEEDWKDRDVVLPKMEPNQIIDNIDLQLINKKTKTPARYGVGRFITEIEGFTRPSTLDTIVDKLEGNQYIEIKKGMLYMTKLGLAVSGWTLDNAPWLSDRDNTAMLEDALDMIESGELTEHDSILTAYTDRIEALKKKIGFIERDYWPPSEAQAAAARGIAERLNYDAEAIERIVSTKKECEAFLKANQVDRSKIGTCPECKQHDNKGQVYSYEKHYGCSNYNKTGCSFSLSKQRLFASLNRWGVDTNTVDLDEIVRKGLGSSPMLFELQGSKGPYSAYLKIEKDLKWGWNFKLSFPRKKNKGLNDDAA